MHRHLRMKMFVENLNVFFTDYFICADRNFYFSFSIFIFGLTLLIQTYGYPVFVNLYIIVFPRVLKLIIILLFY